MSWRTLPSGSGVNVKRSLCVTPWRSHALALEAHRAVRELAGVDVHLAGLVDPGLLPLLAAGVPQVEALALGAEAAGPVLEEDAVADHEVDVRFAERVALGVDDVPLADPEVEFARLGVVLARDTGVFRSCRRPSASADRRAATPDRRRRSSGRRTARRAPRPCRASGRRPPCRRAARSRRRAGSSSRRAGSRRAKACSQLATASLHLARRGRRWCRS